MTTDYRTLFVRINLFIAATLLVFIWITRENAQRAFTYLFHAPPKKTELLVVTENSETPLLISLLKQLQISPVHKYRVHTLNPTQNTELATRIKHADLIVSDGDKAAWAVENNNKQTGHAHFVLNHSEQTRKQLFQGDSIKNKQGYTGKTIDWKIRLTRLRALFPKAQRIMLLVHPQSPILSNPQTILTEAAQHGWVAHLRTVTPHTHSRLISDIPTYDLVYILGETWSPDQERSVINRARESKTPLCVSSRSGLRAGAPLGIISDEQEAGTEIAFQIESYLNGRAENIENPLEHHQKTLDLIGLTSVIQKERLQSFGITFDERVLYMMESSYIIDSRFDTRDVGRTTFHKRLQGAHA